MTFAGERVDISSRGLVEPKVRANPAPVRGWLEKQIRRRKHRFATGQMGNHLSLCKLSQHWNRRQPRFGAALGKTMFAPKPGKILATHGIDEVLLHRQDLGKGKVFRAQAAILREVQLIHVEVFRQDAIRKVVRTEISKLLEEADVVLFLDSQTIAADSPQSVRDRQRNRQLTSGKLSQSRGETPPVFPNHRQVRPELADVRIRCGHRGSALSDRKLFHYVPVYRLFRQ